MGKLELQYKLEQRPDSERSAEVLQSAIFKSFNSAILGLGSISQEGESIEALEAIFDLEGFTQFCNQIDPHLVVPEYLDRFLGWIFNELATELTLTEHDGKVFLWARLPFFAKFLGDGILFLWNTKYADNLEDIGNIVVSLDNIRQSYSSNFLPSVRSEFTKPPPRLRCGIARGQVISIGEGADYVGSCINMASRLQKLGKLTFAFPRRGFNLTKCFAESYAEGLLPQRVNIRGIGDGEIVMVLKAEHEALDQVDRAQFSDP